MREPNPRSDYRCNSHAVIALANRQPKAADLSLRLDLIALGLAGRELPATDERSGKALPIQAGHFTVEVQGRDYPGRGKSPI